MALKLRLKYAIHFLSDTEIRFEVIKFNEENLINKCYVHPSKARGLGWWVAVPGLPKGLSYIDIKSKIIFIVPGKGDVITFKSLKHRDKVVKKVISVLEAWKFAAYVR